MKYQHTIAFLNIENPESALPHRVRLAVVMTRGTLVSNAWLADRLQMEVPGAVTQYVRRFQLQGKTHARSFQADLLRIHT